MERGHSAMTDILIRDGKLFSLERGPTDVTSIPPAASLITADDWETLCKQAGGEAALIKELGVTDERQADV